MDLLFGLGMAAFSIIATYYFIKWFVKFIAPEYFTPVVKCHTCGHTGKAKIVREGSGFIELALFIFFIIPGILYSMHRKSTQKLACSECGATQGVAKVKVAA